MNVFCCATSLGFVRIQAQRQHLKGSICRCCGCLRDMCARECCKTAPLPNAGQLTTLSCVTVVVNSRISMINFHPRPRHTRERDRSLNPHSIVLGPILRLQVRPALRLRATPAVYRSSAGFSISILGLTVSTDFRTTN